MKKLLFVLAFAFIGQQAFSQIYIVYEMNSYVSPPHPCNDGSSSNYTQYFMTLDPTGLSTTTCITTTTGGNGDYGLTLQTVFNDIINQGYKPIPGSFPMQRLPAYTSTTTPQLSWYFSIP